MKRFTLRAHAPLLWLWVHGLLLAAFLISLAVSPIRFNTSLFDILPPSHSLKSVAAADAQLSSQTSRAITMLAYAEDFATAKAAAAALYAYCSDERNDKSAAVPQVTTTSDSAPASRGDIPPASTARAARLSGYFDELTLYVSAADTAALTDFLLENRFKLLDSQTIAQLEAGGAETLAGDALSEIYGAFSLLDFATLERDPFNLSGSTLMRYLASATASAASMSVQDDVLAAQRDGVWYILLRGVLTEQATSLQSGNAIQQLYALCADIAATTGAQFAFSGVPFHSYESASSAQRQVSIISTLGLVLIIALFLYMFRSLLPALVAAGAVVFSCAMALVAVLLVFREIHVLTFVFGTTLIGTCLDYSIHFFVHWKGDATVSDGCAIRSSIWRGIACSFLSTEICFAALYLAPFPFLKQVSVFLFTGLLSAFLCVVCLYPSLPLPAAGRRQLRLGALHCRLPLGRRVARLLPLFLCVASVAVLLVCRNEVKIDNNLRDMYTMSDSMLQNETLCAQVLDYGSAGWYYLVEGDSADAVLQAEERFTAQLAAACDEGALGSYLATSRFVPSQRAQQRSYTACEALLPLAASQYAALGFPAEAELAYASEYAAASERSVTPSGTLPSLLQSVTKSLWLGNVNGRYYSCILPLQVHADEAFFRALSEQALANGTNVLFVNKVSDISAELNRLTATMLKLLLAAFALVIVLLAFFYPLRTVARIATIPLLVALVTVTVLAACRLPIGFFSVTGLVLVFGLGLDYIIYAIEGERASANAARTNAASSNAANARFLNNAAIALSFATTALSFGALAFISFAPVHTIGLTVFVGLTTACISAFASALAVSQ